MSAKFKAITVQDILDQIDRGLTPDFSYVHWSGDQGQYVADVSALSRYESKVTTGVTGLPITIHQRTATPVVNSAQLPTMEAIMSEISNRTQKRTI